MKPRFKLLVSFFLLFYYFLPFTLSSQCKSLTSYKYKNVDEVIIYTPLYRCSKGISDHVSHSFSYKEGNFRINTSVELPPIREAMEHNEMVYIFTLGNDQKIEKNVNKKHYPIEDVVSNSLSDISDVLDGVAIIGSLLGGGSYSGSPKQKIKYIVNESIFSQEEFEAIKIYGISNFRIKYGQDLSLENVYKYNKDFEASSKQLTGCVLDAIKNKENIKESKYYKPTLPGIGELSDPKLVHSEILNLIQQKLNTKYTINEDFSFLGIVDKDGKIDKVKLKSTKLDKKIIKALENLIENINYNLSPALDIENKPRVVSFSSEEGFY